MGQEYDYDTVVVGAGAAGLLAGARAAECGERTLLLEKNRRAGTKILMSGGTRCNITHATDRRGIVNAFREQGSFLHSALAALPPDAVVRLIESQGVQTKVEPGGKIFPVSDRAVDVLEALLDIAAQSQCELAFNEPLAEIVRRDPFSGGFCLTTSKREIRSRRLILTTGGQSYPGSGTTGDGYGWLRKMGHTIVPPRPALTPITTNDAWVHNLKGLTIPDVRLCVSQANFETAADPANQLPANPKHVEILDERRGSFLFTHFGLSGPVALDLSRIISRNASPHRLRLKCDFLPDRSVESLDVALREAIVTAGKKQIVAPLSQLIPRRLAESLLDSIGIDTELRAAELPKSARRGLINGIKGWAVSVAGTRGFKKAEVTAGGVSRDEVDSRTMASRIVPGLFIAGELLDIDGPIGGYNFQAAFSTGWLAGQSGKTH